MPEGIATDGHLIHPALLDAAIQPAAALAAGDGDDGRQGPKLPFAWTGVSVHAAGRHRPTGHAHRRRRRHADGAHAADPAGQPVAVISALTLRPLPPGALAHVVPVLPPCTS